MDGAADSLGFLAVAYGDDASSSDEDEDFEDASSESSDEVGNGKG